MELYFYLFIFWFLVFLFLYMYVRKVSKSEYVSPEEWEAYFKDPNNKE